MCNKDKSTNTIGGRICDFREHTLHLSQEAFAEKLKMHATSISKLETDSSFPSGNTLAELAKLGADVNWILLGENANK